MGSTNRTLLYVDVGKSWRKHRNMPIYGECLSSNFYIFHKCIGVIVFILWSPSLAQPRTVFLTQSWPLTYMKRMRFLWNESKLTYRIQGSSKKVTFSHRFTVSLETIPLFTFRRTLECVTTFLTHSWVEKMNDFQHYLTCSRNSIHHLVYRTTKLYARFNVVLGGIVLESTWAFC